MEEMAEVKVKCPYCNTDEVVKYGKSKRGEQKYRCKACKKTFMLEYKNRAYEPGMKEKIIEMVMNGAGTRDTGRVLKISKNTVTNTLKKNNQNK